MSSDCSNLSDFELIQQLAGQKPYAEMLEQVSPYVQRLTENMTRVDGLINLHAFLVSIISENDEIGSRIGADPDEILRAATVLLHASLEDFLRSLTLENLPRKQDLLNAIPIAGFKNSRKTTIGLGDLAKVYHGKSVDEVIFQSIESWLNQTSFNNTSDLSSILKKLGIDVEQFEHEFSDLNKMIKRRHKIVHEADRDPQKPTELLSIDANDVLLWRNTVTLFMGKTLASWHQQNSKTE